MTVIYVKTSETIRERNGREESEYVREMFFNQKIKIEREEKRESQSGEENNEDANREVLLQKSR